MPKVATLTDKAPKPLPGIYSQAIVANGMVYCSGAVAMDPVTMKLVDGDVQAHTVSGTTLLSYSSCKSNPTCFNSKLRHSKRFCEGASQWLGVRGIGDLSRRNAR